MKNGRVEVLLTKRADDDIHWPGMLHTPGTVVRATDRLGSYQDAFDRLIHDELGSVEVRGEPQFLCTLFHENNRGVESSVVYYIEVTGESPTGTFWSVDDLPSTVIPIYVDLIPEAAQAFRTHLESV